MCLAVDYTTTHPKSPSWKKGTRDGVLRFLVDSRSNVLQYQRPLHPCIFSHCENTAHGYINRPFASASKSAAILNIAQKYRLEDTTKRSEPCLSSNMSAMRVRHGGRSNEEGSVAAAVVYCIVEEKKKRRKRRSCWAQPWLLQWPKYGAYHCLLRELVSKDPKTARNFLRMSYNTFLALLARVGPRLEKQATVKREAIKPGERLAITLRYLGSGKCGPSDIHNDVWRNLHVNTFTTNCRSDRATATGRIFQVQICRFISVSTFAWCLKNMF